VVLDTEGGRAHHLQRRPPLRGHGPCADGEAEAHWLLKVAWPRTAGQRVQRRPPRAAFRGKRTPVKAALLDQRIVAGLGNIYVCEALYRAGISPLRQAGRIGRPRIARLSPIIRDVLAEAIEAGGSSLRDYRQADGDLGYFQHNFASTDREGEPCQTPDCRGVIRRIVQSGRSSFYCPACQR
jgi:formamidopyrimidine-DNA glycosylase